MSEHPVRFGRRGTLVGVVSDPPDAAGCGPRPAVILLGAGIVHRIGPHRLYVKLSRALAEMGFVVLRFDFSGIGDSRPDESRVPFETNAVAEVREAMDWLSDARGVQRFLLIAVCSGAGFSFRSASVDPRVVGIALINPAGHRWGTREEFDRTLTRHYWRMISSRSFRKKNWRKLLTLKFDKGTFVKAAAHRLGARVATTVRETPAADGIAAGFATLLTRNVRLLLVYSEGDEGWDYYRLFLRDRLRSLAANGSFQLTLVRGADHTFTLLTHQQALADVVRPWAASID